MTANRVRIIFKGSIRIVDVKDDREWNRIKIKHNESNTDK